MKIHTHIEIDIETGKVVKDEFYEYNGPIAHCKGDTTVVTPEKSADELEQIKIQNDILKKQLQQSEDTTPLYMKQLGMIQDESGKWVEQTDEQKLAAMTPLEKAKYMQEMENLGLDIYGNKLTEEQLLSGMTDTERLNYETTKLSTERLQKALSGTLPISPALEQELSDQETQMKENLSRKLGANWELSTPGQKAMSPLKEKADLVREEARRGEITSGDVRFQNSVSSGLAKLNADNNSWETELRRKMGLTSEYASASDTSKALNTSMGLTSTYEKDRNLKTSAEMQSTANRAAAAGGVTAAVGSVVGGLAAGASAYMIAAAV